MFRNQSNTCVCCVAQWLQSIHLLTGDLRVCFLCGLLTLTFSHQYLLAIVVIVNRHGSHLDIIIDIMLPVFKRVDPVYVAFNEKLL